jgi:oligopeptide transport system permease protein
MTQDTHGNLWRDVRRDMLKNPAALVGIITLLLIAVFCLSGRWWWRVDPNALDLTQISQAPHSGLLTTVITKNSLEKKSPDAIQQFQALLPANTEAVTLGWPTQQHRHFRLYRHILPPSDAQDLGLPLADFAANSQETVLQYQDALLLENRRYFYSLAVIDDSGNINSYQTISVDVAHATPLENLIQEGVLSSTANAPATLQLPAHPFGTDKLGRDLMARLIEGGRTSLFIGFTAPLLYVLFGALYGAMAGYRGGRTDTLMMAFADFMIALPFLLFVILLRIAFGIGPGDSGITALIVVLLLLS